jgi:hypothetical protein
LSSSHAWIASAASIPGALASIVDMTLTSELNPPAIATPNNRVVR